MKLWIATFAATLASAGLAEPGRRASAAPSEGELRRSYEKLIERSMCGGVAGCRQAEVDSVSQVECAPAGRSGRVRCNFALHVETPMPGRGHTSLAMNVHLHLCSGLFQRRRSGWKMLSVLGECPPLSTGARAE